MFEAELELERKESSVLPLVLVLVLAAVILGGIGGVVYMVVQTKRGLPKQDAATVIERALKAQGPAVTHFHTGLVKSSVNEKPLDPHYKLLEKLGLITFKAQKDGRSAQVALTPEGQKKLASLADLQKSDDKDGTVAYIVPLADRRLVEVSNVVMNGPHSARVEYAWKWEPNEIGEAFDAQGKAIKAFNTWDRMSLIQKYGADFYHADATRQAVVLVKKDGNWIVSND